VLRYDGGKNKTVGARTGRSQMRTLQSLSIALASAALLAAAPLRAEDAFDACEVFTAADAEAVLGTQVAPEPVNPKVKRPKVIPTCSYSAFKEGKPVEARVQFRFGKTNEEAQRAFEEHRLQVQTKPMLTSGAEMFWSGKTGQMNLRKGRTWAQVTVGPQKPSERDIDQAKKLSEVIARKM
jgi:hypothetical protein